MPKVILAWPPWRQPWPNRAACWSTTLATMGRPPIDPKAPAVGRISAQRLDRHAEQAAQLRIPLSGIEVHQAGARGRGDVGGVDAGQAVEEEAVAGAEPELAALQQLLRARRVIDDPAQLAGGEVGIERQAGAGGDQLRGALLLQLLGERQGAGVLPDDGVADGLAAVGVPGDDGLALVGEAEGDGVAGQCQQLRTWSSSSSGSCSTQPCCG